MTKGLIRICGPELRIVLAGEATLIDWRSCVFQRPPADDCLLMDLFCMPAQTVFQASACSAWQVGPSLGSGTITLSDLTQTIQLRGT